MSPLHHPAPETIRTPSGMTAHLWPRENADHAPVLLIHGYGSNVLFNWVKTGWLDPLAAQGRSILAVDLPGHGTSADVDPTGVRSSDLQSDLKGLLTEFDGGAEGQAAVVHGYSLGSRIAWEFAAGHPQLVGTLVMGGSAASDRLAAVDAEQARRWAQDGTPPQDELTRSVVTVAAAVPDQNVRHVVELLLSLAEDPYVPKAAVPAVPTLVVAGARDEVASDASQLAELVRHRGAWSRYVEIPGRNHVNVLTARAYKDAVLQALS